MCEVYTEPQAVQRFRPEAPSEAAEILGAET